jgi:hypothetical protein
MRFSNLPTRKTRKTRTHRELPSSHKITPEKNFPGKIEDSTLLHCVLLEETEKNRIMMRMSPESIRISNETKWNEKGFIPSFKNTDKKLIAASRRAYKILGYSE